MQKQKNGHTGLLPNVTVIPFFPLEDVWIMVFELSLIRFAFISRGFSLMGGSAHNNTSSVGAEINLTENS